MASSLDFTPLNGVRVLEVATILAGPWVGMVASHYGAEVIKVEPLGGDPTRRWYYPGEEAPPLMSAYFATVNAGKQSIELNLKSAADRAIFYRLIERSDVLLTNHTSEVAQALHTTPAHLRPLNPHLIHINITAYGDADCRKGYDALLQADTGFMNLNGFSDGPPLKMPVAFIDLIAAHHAFEGLLLAVLCQYQGKSTYQYLSVTLQSVGVVSLMNQAMNYLASLRQYVPRRMGSQHPNIVPYGEPFLTRDGKWVVLAIGSDAQYQRLCELIEDEELWHWGNNPVSRNLHRTRIYDRLRREIAQWDSNTFLQMCRAQAIPATRVRSIDEVLSDPRFTPFLVRFPAYPFEGIIPSPLQGITTATLSAPPQLNEHGEYLRRLLGSD